MEYIAGNCPSCNKLVIQPKALGGKTRFCLECMRIATSPPYTFVPGFYTPMELPYANKPQVDLGFQCSTILKAVFHQ